MSRQHRGGQRRRTQRRPTANDIWHTPPALPEQEPITVPVDPSAMLRSLGDPPMNAGPAAGGYFAMVVERTSGMARALAATFGLLEQPDGD